jgi:hypothetical protein
MADPMRPAARAPSSRRRLAGLLTLLALLPATVLSGTQARGAPVAPGALRVDVSPSPLGPPVPARFLGLSFEAQALPDLARFSTAGDLPLLLRSLGPSVLRLGGVTADSRVAYTDAAHPPPAWTTTPITAAELRGLARLARGGDDGVLFTLGLVHDDPAAAAREAAAASRALGSSLLALEIGNEPDAYGVHGLRPQPWTAAQYAGEVQGYRAAIAAAAPGLAFAGPDTTGASFSAWGPSFAELTHPALLTAHRYPLVCDGAPTIAALLAPSTRARDVAQLRGDVQVAAGAGIPLRVDEVNSVSCGGRSGVSDTFASALWAVRFITEAMQLGISGVNFHDLPASCAGYSPLCARSADALAAGRLTAAPEWYGLLFTRSLVGDRPLATALTGSSGGVTATAFGGAGEVRVVLVDTDPGGAARPLRIAAGPGWRTATVLDLSAPSLSAAGGVTIGGHGVNADGELLGPLRRDVVHSVHGGFALSLAPAGAALVTLSR